jgi:hypothetical protein
MRQITDLVESMADYFGSELTLYYIRRAPAILELDFPTVASRCRGLRDVLGVEEYEQPLLLRKCPALLLLEPQELRARYEALPQVLRLAPDKVSARRGPDGRRRHPRVPHAAVAGGQSAQLLRTSL